MNNIIRLPGLIDIHVHFRDPGQTHKEDFFSGTYAALAGGVTCVFDMPNNITPIFSNKVLMQKIDIVKKKAVCDWGLYFGTDGRNLDQFEKVTDKVIGLKVYLNATTGNLLIEDEGLVEEIFYRWPKSNVIVIHAEGEKVDLAIDLSKKFGNKIHITHVATGDDLEKILSAKSKRANITCDVTPHHLFLTKDQIGKKHTFRIINSKVPPPTVTPLSKGSSDGGTKQWIFSGGEENSMSGGFYKVKPSLATKEDQKYLWNHISKIDCIASDHAPHTIEEKKSDKPPSGISGVETILPLLLTAVSMNRLAISDIIRMTNKNPQKIFNFNQNDNTYIEVDIKEKYKINNNNLITKCSNSPFDGWEVSGKVKRVYIRDKKVYENGKLLVNHGYGRNILRSFLNTSKAAESTL